VLASLRGPDAAISGIEDERAVNRAAEPERHRLHGSHVGLEQVLSRIVEVAGGPRAVRRCRAVGARVGDSRGPAYRRWAWAAWSRRRSGRRGSRPWALGSALTRQTVAVSICSRLVAVGVASLSGQAPGPAALDAPAPAKTLMTASRCKRTDPGGYRKELWSLLHFQLSTSSRGAPDRTTGVTPLPSDHHNPGVIAAEVPRRSGQPRRSEADVAVRQDEGASDHQAHRPRLARILQ
jgi:hypothetical protein